MRVLQSLVLLLIVSAAGMAQTRGQGPMPGDVAPDFTLNTKDGSGSITLSALDGRPTALVFASYT
jgi:hypothetical protein